MILIRSYLLHHHIMQNSLRKSVTVKLYSSFISSFAYVYKLSLQSYCDSNIIQFAITILYVKAMCGHKLSNCRNCSRFQRLVLPFI